MNIGDLLLRILADDSGFQADLTKKAETAGEAAGTTLGQRMGKAIKDNGTAIIGGALAGGLALMGKGIIELQNITADFRAETGATAAEADRAGKAINAMSGKNIQPMAEIGAALTKVHTELHQTGDQAEQTTQQFLTFGRVTKVSAATEVEVFHRILAAWNLTADKTGAIMDALVLSHQRFGGVISEDEAALQALAPALLAANQTWQDGLALINLFKESGVDTAVAVTAMTKALAKVKSPEELQKLIADITATEDPFLRAQKAIDLFGAKAGAKLADVLRPGMGGLENYSVSAADAAGATQQAADVLDSTWGARFQLMIKAAGSAIVGFGNDWAGAAQVAGTAAAAFAPLARKLAGPLIDALKGVWLKIAASSAVTQAVAFASGKAATVYLAGLIAGDAIGAALSRAWAATGGRLLAAAGISGAASGTAFAVAAAAAIVAAPLAVLFVSLKITGDIEKQGNDLKAQTTAWLKTVPSDPDLQNAIKGIQEQLDQIPLNAFGARGITVDVLNQLIAESNKRAGQVVAPLAAIGAAGSVAFEKLGGASARARAMIEASARAMAVAARILTERLLAETLALITGYYDPLIAQEDLLVQKEEVAMNRRAVAVAAAALEKTKAGTKERADAQLTYDQSVLTLTNSQKNLDTTRANLLAAGELSRKDQRAWLADLQARYKTATGAARTYIGQLIAKIEALQRIPDTVVTVTVVKNNNKGTTGGGEILGEGGPVKAGVPVIVGDKGHAEFFVPGSDGYVFPDVPTMATAQGASGGVRDVNVTVTGLVRARTASEIGDHLRRLADFGALGPQDPA